MVAVPQPVAGHSDNRHDRDGLHRRDDIGHEK
jgi:hypothetical protein